MSTQDDIEKLNQKLLKNNCELKGASKYFFEFKKQFPTYNEIRDNYYKTNNVLENLALASKTN